MQNGLRKRVLLLTGNPGVGKTTVLMKAVDLLKAQGFSVGGIVSCESREGEVRVGFEILNLSNLKRGWLAHINQNAGPQVGKYHVNLKEFEAIGVQAVTEAVDTCDVIVIDEIGPMELFSEKFRQAISKTLGSQKLVIAIVHWKAQDRLIYETKQRKDAELITVTRENREMLPEIITKKALDVLSKCTVKE